MSGASIAPTTWKWALLAALVGTSLSFGCISVDIGKSEKGAASASSTGFSTSSDESSATSAQSSSATSESDPSSSQSFDETQSSSSASSTDETQSSSGSPETFEPFAPHPQMGMHGAAGMHGDSLSSDTTPLAGPASKSLTSKFQMLGAVCPTVLVRKDARLWLYCTDRKRRAPVAILLDPETMTPLAKLPLEAGALLGSVYAYADNLDRLVLVDGQQRILRLSAQKNAEDQDKWDIELAVQRELMPIITKACGSEMCDQVVSISPGKGNSVWWVTRNGLVGLAAENAYDARLRRLGKDEQVHNSFSSTLDGQASIVTDHALYWLDQDKNNEISIRWRRPYDRGPARKPGQLSWGSGATPSFFTHPKGGPMVTITDNAEKQISVLVYDRDGRKVCQHPVFGSSQAGTENSQIAYRDRIVVASTYGYPYPALPKGAGASVPESAEFVGGLATIGLNAEGTECSTLWENSIASAAVPKLSLATKMIYTVQRSKGEGTNDTYHFVAMHAESGELHTKHKLGEAPFHNTMQMAGNADASKSYWQGAVGGVFRIAEQ